MESNILQWKSNCIYEIIRLEIQIERFVGDGFV